MRKLIFLAPLLASFAAIAATHELAMTPALQAQLESAAAGTIVTIEGFPDGDGHRQPLRFERTRVYAPGARLLGDSGPQRENLARSRRIQLRGSGEDGLRVHLSFLPGLEELRGSGTSASGNFVIRLVGGALEVRSETEALPAGARLETIGTDDAVAHAVDATSDKLASLFPQAPAAVPVTALVAVDIDKELMVRRFGGTGSAAQAAALDWLADLFGGMNLMYEADLGVTLLQGTVILRLGSTPYAIAPDASTSQADLLSFGNYWAANHDSVQRSFALLLSGQLSSGYSASGRAWLDSYCRKPSNGGSYGVIKVFTSPSLGASYSVSIVGHELGHLFGAHHSHCTDIATGQAPVAVNTIDQCWNDPGCHAGPVSCPAGGTGTLMSYCHMPTSSGGAGCGPNVDHFHATQIGVLETRIAANTPSCLTPADDHIFVSDFES